MKKESKFIFIRRKECSLSESVIVLVSRISWNPKPLLLLGFNIGVHSCHDHALVQECNTTVFNSYALVEVINGDALAHLLSAFWIDSWAFSLVLSS